VAVDSNDDDDDGDNKDDEGCGGRGKCDNVTTVAATTAAVAEATARTAAAAAAAAAKATATAMAATTAVASWWYGSGGVRGSGSYDSTYYVILQIHFLRSILRRPHSEVKKSYGGTGIVIPVKKVPKEQKTQESGGFLHE
jgi:hypothetical protein